MVAPSMVVDTKVVATSRTDRTWDRSRGAREYRETLAVERALETRAIDEKAWAAQQVREHDTAVAVRETAEVN
jgi:hypothetical protein